MCPTRARAIMPRSYETCQGAGRGSEKCLEGVGDGGKSGKRAGGVRDSGRRNFAKVGINYHREGKMDVASACRRLRRRNAMDAFDCANLSSDEATTDSAAGSTYSTATHNAKPVTITISLTLPDNFSTKANLTNAVSDASGIGLTIKAPRSL
jgi:hypothetical protein